jgi:muconolactone delta-isomerase
VCVERERDGEGHLLNMEYLVTMTTHVPAGTADATVDDVRAREAARSRELAAQGALLRLWRPPLEPRAWRTLGLFAADDATRLEDVLASMPLRVWRTDAVTPLSAHPNDPGTSSAAGADAGAQEFLVTFTITVPAGTSGEALADMKAREAQRARELAEEGTLVRLWRLEEAATTWRSLGLWRACDAADMQAALESLPMYSWIVTETTPLTAHPSDPARSTHDN